ncbi:MAG: phosphoglycerate dehydrogenase [Mesorhizobium sp.]|uniref:NAD(P)-dependent oxidoreductase n=1 Tax=Mesorhizobium sp. TaxID=1871066 RepID=UPI000FE64686|nr:NAD(P)-dependent oxidoreductase [Mesorhizobium sp.]RWF80007.1 MAG: phosphoglycerate dehydrogenase [Mesorhizobium sp.]RWP58899.1 MAG: phosphoglycerate dehydrogenase [Mesorhizobium sp.]TIP83829.1 MAG: phosphoglycerate dehydrogenase [Mesorhizobium sp.]TJW50096.1 MAG: phosphoglycerate dehydrogenase [Mesorhizobium sp.]
MKVLCLWHATSGEIKYIEDAMPRGTEVVAPEGEYFSRFEGTYQQLKDHAVNADAFIGWTLPQGIPEIATKLKILSWLHSGVDDLGQNGVLSLAKQRGFKVTNIRGANAIAVAEQAMMFMLALAKKTLLKHEVGREMGAFFPLFGEEHRSAMLDGRTLGLIGVGSIGSQIAKRAKGFGMRVLGVRRNKERPAEFVDSVHGMDELHAVLGQSDYVVLAAPITGETNNFFGEAELKAMKPTAFLVNIARGNLIQEKPVYDALKSGSLRGYGADVWPVYEYGKTFPANFTPRLNIQKLPNVVCSNDQSHDADGQLERYIEWGTENLAEFAAGKPLTRQVNLDLGY